MVDSNSRDWMSPVCGDSTVTKTAGSGRVRNRETIFLMGTREKLLDQPLFIRIRYLGKIVRQKRLG